MKRFSAGLRKSLLFLTALSLILGALGCHKQEDESGGDKNYYTGKDFHPGGKGKSGKNGDM